MSDNFMKRDDDTGFFGRNGTLQGVSEALSGIQGFKKSEDALSKAFNIGQTAQSVAKLVQYISKLFV